jgi:hypothetical protein
VCEQRDERLGAPQIGTRTRRLAAEVDVRRGGERERRCDGSGLPVLVDEEARREDQLLRADVVAASGGEEPELAERRDPCLRGAGRLGGLGRLVERLLRPNVLAEVLGDAAEE